MAQCDLWFPPADVPLGLGQTGRPPVLVMFCGYSRWLCATMIPTRQAPDLLDGHWQLLSRLGTAPKALIWDNGAAAGQWRGGRPQLTETMNAFRSSLGIRVIHCRPADPEAKGPVERANGHLETSFLPGRRFTSPADVNTQLQQWLAGANSRVLATRIEPSAERTGKCDGGAAKSRLQGGSGAPWCTAEKCAVRRRATKDFRGTSRNDGARSCPPGSRALGCGARRVTPTGG